jgi:SAM-dependent methyltransferase
MNDEATNAERDYVLGTHDEEIERLALQHRVWRPRALDAWRRAGFTVGQTLIDLGCGPGFATLDLAEIVGPGGRVVAIDRSRRFLDALEANRAQRGLRNVETLEIDLDEGDLPRLAADGMWGRWVFAFVKRPRDLLARALETIKPGGTIVLYEYLDYSTWRVSPRSPEFEEFVRVVTEAWRSSGGEPDVGLDLPRWLEELGCEVRERRPITDVITPANYVWQWPRAFVDNGLRRLEDLGHMTSDRVEATRRAFAAIEGNPRASMVTPIVLEIIATRA